MIELYRFQKQDVKAIERFDGRALLASDPGLGKTCTALYWGFNYLDLNDGPIIVVCPAGIKSVWEDEAWKHFRVRAEVLDGRKPRRLNGARVYVLNYEILGRHDDPGKTWTNVLKRLNPQLVIVDECHMTKARASLRYKAVKKLQKDVPHLLLLGGTPLTNRPSELWTSINLIHPDLYPSFWSYASEFCNPKRTRFGWDVSGAANLDELHELLTEVCMRRRRKADVLKDLPPKARHVVPLALPITASREYHEAEHNFIHWLHKKGRIKTGRSLKAQALVKMGYLKRLAGTLKLKLVYDWVDSFLAGGDGKLIVFGVHRAVLEPLHARYRGSVLIDGRVTGRQRAEAVRRFTKDDQCRLCFGNIKAAGVGWSAPGVSDVAFVELDWEPGLHEQAESRAHGIARGVEGVATSIWYLVAADTIESRLCKVLQEKAQVISSVLDGGPTPDDIDVLDRLIAHYKGVR